MAFEMRLVILFQRPFHGGEGQLIPGQLVIMKQPHFLGLRAGLDMRVGEHGAVDQLHLMNAGEAIDGEQGR